ncbi:MAG: crossover junction endodeoxyribonuclease RuvC [Phototrophicales bacterium]|nr:MAG: crossover junction endodeoxyribonuclease RuvC [Phototrophicales bacterium]
MLILGLDPGTARTGYGLVYEHPDGTLEAVNYGVFSTKAKIPMAERLLQLHEQLSALLAEHHPNEAAIEELFFGKNVTTAIKVAQARGVLLLTLAQSGLLVGEYQPPIIKSCITGYGNADKNQMQEMVRQLLGLAHIPKPDDAADGLAVAITHLQMTRLDRLGY